MHTPNPEIAYEHITIDHWPVRDGYNSMVVQDD